MFSVVLGMGNVDGIIYPNSRICPAKCPDKAKKEPSTQVDMPSVKKTGVVSN